MESKLDKKSILEMSKGGILERVDYEMGKVLTNIFDVNTRATAKRKITVTLELIPDDSRQKINVFTTSKSSLVPTTPITTALYVTNDGDGEMAVVEMIPQVPGQVAMDGTEQELPKILSFATHA